jgi:hypothetical protein
MATCYLHAERTATSACAICGKGICRECSNWVAGEIYLCPKCWQDNSVAGTTSPEKQEKSATGGLAPELSRVAYYLTAIAIVIVGSWYAYSTFVAPAILTSGGAPPVISSSPLSFGSAWSRYGLLVTVSVVMFTAVLIGGELMLKPKPRTSVASGPKLKPIKQKAQAERISVAAGTGVNVGAEGNHAEAQPAAKQPLGIEPTQTTQPHKTARREVIQPEVQFERQTSRAEAIPDERPVRPIEVTPTNQTRLVYCIYCGSRIPSTAVFCGMCGKGQQ